MRATSLIKRGDLRGLKKSANHKHPNRPLAKSETFNDIASCNFKCDTLERSFIVKCSPPFFLTYSFFLPLPLVFSPFLPSPCLFFTCFLPDFLSLSLLPLLSPTLLNCSLLPMCYKLILFLCYFFLLLSVDSNF